MKTTDETKTGFFSQFRLGESYTSLILGAVVVLVVGILFFAFARGSRNNQTSSTRETPATTATVTPKDSQTSSTYTVKPGDDLWTISENVYKDGYRWTEIAKLNKLENPGIIHAGNKLMMPNEQKNDSSTKSTLSTAKPSSTVQKDSSINSSITANTYTVVRGDNLWNIAVRAYGDGYKWVDIARENKLANPHLIHAGNVFKIPRPK